MAPSVSADTFTPVNFSDHHCANCNVAFSSGLDGVDKHEDFSTLQRQKISNLDALHEVFKAQFQLNNYFAEDSMWTTDIGCIPLCQTCTRALGNLHRFYAEFIKLTTESSALWQLAEKTTMWIDKFRDLQLRTTLSSPAHVKTELNILSDLPDFEDADPMSVYPSTEVGMVDHDSDDDWAWPGSSKKSKKGEDINYKSKAKAVKTEGSAVTRSKTLGVKNVNVSIEPLDPDQLETKEPQTQLGESLAKRKTHLINKHQLRKSTQSLLKRKKAKRGVKLKSKTCSICSKAFKDTHALNQHMFTHSEERKFQCTECPMAYKVRKALNRHMNVRHGVGGVLPDRTCDICGLYFALPSMLKTHKQNVHTTERPFCCEFCGSSFPSLNYLNIHVHQRHKNPKTYKCDQCDKVLMSKPGLKTHIETIHLDKRDFPCDQCPKRFYLAKALKIHMLTHEDKDSRERTHTCKYCDAKFMTKTCARMHEKKHKMGQDKLCADCGASFKNKSSLQRHIESKHTEGGEFPCELCGKVFKLKDYLMQHMRSKTHGGLGHYIERLKEGTTTRAVNKVVPLTELESGVVPASAPEPQTSTKKVHSRSVRRKSVPRTGRNRSNPEVEVQTFIPVEEEPDSLSYQQVDQIVEVQYILAPF